MNNTITEIVYILDRSGSMNGLEDDTIGGFNSMMKKQREEEGAAYVSTILFDDEPEVLHDRIKIAEVPDITDKEYFVGGCTALLDALGGAIKHINKLHKDMGECAPEKTLFIVTTDGMENASHKYTYDKVKKMVKKRQEKDGWEFIFVGANIDSFDVAENIGFKKERTMNYVCDGVGTAVLYAGLHKAVSAARKAESVDELDCCMDESGWQDEIKADYQKRSKK